ncbi:unnamed protein product [Rhizopus stolonifer]
MSQKLALIVAATEELGIGRQGGMPWHLPKDMAFFRKVTTTLPKHTTTQEVQNVVIMGRVTWESIPIKFRPMKDRFNIIVSRNPSYDLQLSETNENVILVQSFEEALEKVDKEKHSRVFVIGGAQMYQMAVKHADCTDILLTRIKSKIECDTFFPEVNEKEYRLASHQELEEYVQDTVPEGIQTHKDLEYEFTLYKRFTAE